MLKLVYKFCPLYTCLFSSDFLLGPAEDVPRPMDCLSFVSHEPPHGHVTLNELRCYEKIPDLFANTTTHNNDCHGNSGHGNSGHGNSDHGNSGHGNSGHGNSGHGNSGHRNYNSERNGLELLLEAMEPDIDMIR